MKAITVLASSKFWNGEEMKSSNTRVEISKNEIQLYLFDNLIAVKFRNENKIMVSNCGYETATTKERLNGILFPIGYKIFQKMFTWYIEDPKGNIEEFRTNKIIDLERVVL